MNKRFLYAALAVLLLALLFLVYIDIDETTDGDDIDSGSASSDESLSSDFTPSEGSSEGPWEFGPWNTRLLLAISDDGVHFTRKDVVVSDQGDVPDLAIDENGRIYLYYTGWSLSVGSTEQSNKTVDWLRNFNQYTKPALSSR